MTSFRSQYPKTRFCNILLIHALEEFDFLLNNFYFNILYVLLLMPLIYIWIISFDIGIGFQTFFNQVAPMNIPSVVILIILMSSSDYAVDVYKILMIKS